MQQRFHISYHPSFEDANAAKASLAVRNTDKTYQIRKRSESKFELVVRVSAKEVALNPENITKKRRRR